MAVLPISNSHPFGHLVRRRDPSSPISKDLTNFALRILAQRTTMAAYETIKSKTESSPFFKRAETILFSIPVARQTLPRNTPHTDFFADIFRQISNIPKPLSPEEAGEDPLAFKLGLYGYWEALHTIVADKMAKAESLARRHVRLAKLSNLCAKLLSQARFTMASTRLRVIPLTTYRKLSSINKELDDLSMQLLAKASSNKSNLIFLQELQLCVFLSGLSIDDLRIDLAVADKVGGLLGIPNLGQALTRHYARVIRENDLFLLCHELLETPVPERSTPFLQLPEVVKEAETEPEEEAPPPLAEEPLAPPPKIHHFLAALTSKTPPVHERVARWSGLTFSQSSIKKVLGFPGYAHNPEGIVKSAILRHILPLPLFLNLESSALQRYAKKVETNGKGYWVFENLTIVLLGSEAPPISARGELSLDDQGKAYHSYIMLNPVAGEDTQLYRHKDAIYTNLARMTSFQPVDTFYRPETENEIIHNNWRLSFQGNEVRFECTHLGILFIIKKRS